MTNQGLVIVYTGNGKGKTTAALGLALRQIGQGGRVLFLQFLKASDNGGEHQAARSLPGLEMVPYGRKGFIIGTPAEEDVLLAKEGLMRAEKALGSGEYSMIVLDEVNVALNLGLLDSADIHNLLQRRGSAHIVLTGRGAGESLFQEADIVSEVLEIKHDFRQGRNAEAGIEF